MLKYPEFAMTKQFKHQHALRAMLVLIFQFYVTLERLIKS